MDNSTKGKKGAAGRRGGGPKKKLVSRSVKVGFQFPVGRNGRYLKKVRYSQCVGTRACIGHGDVLPNMNQILLPNKSEKDSSLPSASPRASSGPERRAAGSTDNGNSPQVR